MPAIATVLSIFVIPSLHAVLRPCSRTGVAKRRCGLHAPQRCLPTQLPWDLTGSAPSARAEGASSSRVSAHSGASATTCKGPSLYDKLIIVEARSLDYAAFQAA